MQDLEKQLNAIRDQLQQEEPIRSLGEMMDEISGYRGLFGDNEVKDYMRQAYLNCADEAYAKMKELLEHCSITDLERTALLREIKSLRKNIREIY